MAQDLVTSNIAEVLEQNSANLLATSVTLESLGPNPANIRATSAIVEVLCSLTVTGGSTTVAVSVMV